MEMHQNRIKTLLNKTDNNFWIHSQQDKFSIIREEICQKYQQN